MAVIDYNNERLKEQRELNVAFAAVKDYAIMKNERMGKAQQIMQRAIDHLQGDPMFECDDEILLESCVALHLGQGFVVE